MIKTHIGDIFIIGVLFLLIFGLPLALVIVYRIVCWLFNYAPRWWVAVIVAFIGFAINYFVIWPELRFPE